MKSGIGTITGCLCLLILSSDAFSAIRRTVGVPKKILKSPCDVQNVRAGTQSSSSSLMMNFLTDMLTGGALEPESNLPYSPPLCGTDSICGDVRTFAVRERAISFTGEDFDVFDADNNQPFVRVRGAMLHLPGKDKMRIRSEANGEETVVLDRKLIAVTPTYDIYRGDGEKIGWIEKEIVALTETFDIYMEGQGGIGPFKPPPAYQISGDFLERNFVMKNNQGQVVAKVMKDGLIQFDSFNHYQVQVGPGMDAMLVLACTCAIDEEFDEEHKEKKRKEAEGGGGWF